MPAFTQATLRYLVNDPKWTKIKPYEITGPRPHNLPRHNLEFSEHVDIQVEDVREVSPKPSLSTFGFEYATHHTENQFEEESGVDRYVLEMEEFVKSYLGAEIVHTFQYQIRKRMKEPQRADFRPPSNFVHIDMMPTSSKSRVELHLNRLVDKIGNQRCTFISIWRPITGPVKDYPLAVCNTQSVEDADLVETDYLYPNFESETYTVLYNSNHKWYYLSDQTTNDVLLISNYDSLTGNRIPHSGFELLGLEEAEVPRESIEIKMIVIGASV